MESLLDAFHFCLVRRAFFDPHDRTTDKKNQLYKDDLKFFEPNDYTGVYKSNVLHCLYIGLYTYRYMRFRFGCRHGNHYGYRYKRNYQCSYGYICILCTRTLTFSRPSSFRCLYKPYFNVRLVTFHFELKTKSENDKSLLTVTLKFPLTSGDK